MNLFKSILILMGLTSGLWASHISELKYSCGKKECYLDFQFGKNKSLPSFYQRYDAASSVLKVAFSRTTTIGEGKLNISSKSKVIQSVDVKMETTSKNTPLLVFYFKTGSAIKNDRNPVKLNPGNVFRITLANPSKGKTKTWSFSANKSKLKSKELVKTKADQNQALEKTKPQNAKTPALSIPQKATAAKTVQKSKERAPNLTGKPKIQNLGFLQEPGFERFYLELSGDVSKINLRVEGNRLFLKSDSLFVPKGLKKLSIPGSFLIASLKTDWEKKYTRIQVNFNKGVVPRIIRTESMILIQGSSSSIQGDLVIWSWSKGNSQNYAFRADIPSDEQMTLDTFFKENVKKGQAVSTSQTFRLKGGLQKLYVTAKKAELKSAPDSKSQTMTVLTFGTVLQRQTSNDNWYQVKFGQKLGWVSKSLVSYPDELSKLQNENLKSLAMTQKVQMPPQVAASPEKKVQEKKAANKNQEKIQSKVDAKLSAQVVGDSLSDVGDSLGVSFQEQREDKVTYSSFGRRDPFIQLQGPSDDGINIDGVELVGIIWEAEEPMALLSDTRSPGVSYTLKEGDKILNGKVLKITPEEVLFLIHEFGVSRRYTMILPEYGSAEK